MPETDYKLTIDEKLVVKSLQAVDDKFDDMAKSGDQAMKKIEKSGLIMGNVLGGVVGGVFEALTGAAIEFGKETVAVLANIVKSSTKAAIEFDTTRKKFISIFEGQEESADAVMDKISKRASKLGLDMNEALSLSRAFLPDVKGTEDPLGALDDLLVGVRALAEEDPIQGIVGARIAIDEAMSGSLRSLKERFEFTKTEVEILEKAQVELGQVVGTIEGINKVMERRGVDVEALEGTFTQAMGEMQFAAGKLRIELGKPVASQMTESMESLNKILAENSDDLELMAGAIGDVVAKIVDFVGTNLTGFLEGLDTEGVLELTDGLNSAVNSAELLLDVLFNIDDASLFNSLIGRLTSMVESLRQAAQTAAQITAIARAENAQALAEIEILGHFGLFADAETKARAAAEGQKAYDQAIRDSLPSFEKFSAAEKQDTERKRERKDAQDANTEAALAEAEAFLKEGDAASKTADALAELGLAEEDLGKIQEDIIKTQEKLVAAEEKSTQERLDIARDFLQERSDLELEFSQDRVDLARESLEDIAAIEADHLRDIEDQGLRLSRSSRDLARKQGIERTDVAKDQRRDLLDVEENFQEEMRRIQRQAQLSLEEAERGLDAQAFVKALRQQEIGQEEAAVTREQAERDVRLGSAQRLEELEQAQAEERSNLQQSDRDKLNDLQIRLRRELDAQTLSDKLALEQQGIDETRRLEQQTISEERRLEQQAISEKRRLDALIQGQAERLAKMVEGLDAETAAVVLAEANKLAAVQNFAGAAEAVLNGLIANVQTKANKIEATRPDELPLHLPIIQKSEPPESQPEPPRLGGEEEGAGDIVSDQLPLHLPIIQKRRGGGVRSGRIYRVGEVGLEGYIPRRAFGGDTKIGQPTIVGEFGEELFIPPSSGTIIPNNQMGAILGNTTNMQQSISNTQNNLGGFSLSASMFEDPIQRSQLENFVLEVMSRN